MEQEKKEKRMYFYPKHITQEAIEALQAVGLQLDNTGEMAIPDTDISENSDESFTARGVKLERHLITFDGFIDAPKVFSTLEGGMVPTGVDQYQCKTCGYWMDRKMTVSDEIQHDRQCGPRYEWVLA